MHNFIWNTSLKINLILKMSEKNYFGIFVMKRIAYNHFIYKYILKYHIK